MQLGFGIESDEGTRMRSGLVTAPSLRLDEGIIDIWALPIQPSDLQIAAFHNILSPDERTRARRFRFDHLQRSFIFRRGTLRVLLGGYLSIAPQEVSFSYGSQGKPRISKEKLLRFNTSHSGGIVLLAFTHEYDIGVDIEKMYQLPEMDDLVQRFFCPEEISQFASIPYEQRERAFFCCWTRKEAYLKAVGSGLSNQLDSFCVTLNPIEPARLLHINGDNHAAQAWTLQDLPFPSRHAGAIAYRGTPRPIRQRSLENLAALQLGSCNPT
jgi:4'-phosphopantetheinyl transferase